jgi:hypothetical protein
MESEGDDVLQVKDIVKIEVGTLWVDREPFADLDPEVVIITEVGTSFVYYDIKIGAEWLGIKWSLPTREFLSFYRPVENGIQRAQKVLRGKSKL